MTREDWIKTEAIVKEFKREYKENFGLGLVEHKVMLVIFSVLLALVEDKINER